MTTRTEKFETTTRPAQSLAGKYLTFFLGEESYGLPVIKVREIIRFLSPTHVPQLPEHVEGVINLRGKIIPVINLRRKFGLAACESGERTCTVVVNIKCADRGGALIGLVVDGVEEVVQISASDLEPTPEFGPGADTHHILGMAKVKGAIKTLLNLDQVISTDLIESATAQLDSATLAP
jgi:purine-binding chemotaxis protein CheW